MSGVSGSLILEPEELFFPEVSLQQTYSQTLRITNNLGALVEATVRPGSTDRYTVNPSRICLKAGESITCKVQLRVNRFAAKQKASEQGQRDFFLIKATYFDQKFYSTFILQDPASRTAAVRKPQAQADERAAPAAVISKKLGEGSPSSQSSNAAGRNDRHESLRPDVAELRSSAQRNRHSSHPGHSSDGNNLREEIDLMPRNKVPLPSSRSQSPSGRGGDAESSRDCQQATESHHVQQLTMIVQQQALAIREKEDTVAHLCQRLHAAQEDALRCRSGAARELPDYEDQQHAQLADLQAANAQLEGANAHLRMRVQDLSNEAAAAQEEVNALEGLQKELCGRVPDTDNVVAAALIRERALQDARNKKVLELLSSKDDVIQQFEVRFIESQSEARRLADELAKTQKQLCISEARISDLLEAQAKQRRAAAARAQEFTMLHASLTATITDLTAERDAALKKRSPGRRRPAQDALAPSLRADVELHRDALAVSQEEVAELRARLADAEREQERQAALSATKELELDHLRAQVSEMEDLLATSVSRSTPESHEQQGSSAALPGVYEAVQERLRVLEEVNAKLESALQHAQEQHHFTTEFSSLDAPGSSMQEEQQHTTNSRAEDAESALLEVARELLDEPQSAGNARVLAAELKARLAGKKRSAENAERKASRAAKELEMLRATSQAEVEALQRCLTLGGEVPREHSPESSLAKLQGELRKSRQEAADARRQAEEDGSQAEELRYQLGLHKDTMQTIQAGLPGEKEQRIVTLTALLTAAKSEIVALERKFADTSASTEAREAALSSARQECKRNKEIAEDLELKLAVATEQAEVAGKRANAALADLGTSEGDLSRALQSAQAQIVHMAAEARLRAGRQATADWTAGTLQRKLTAAETSVRDLEARLAAAAMESAGTADFSKGSSIAQAGNRRDETIQAWFETELRACLSGSEPAEKVVTLGRQLCALQVANSQLAARQEAAGIRADALVQGNAQLRLCLEDSERHLEKARQQVIALQLHSDAAQQEVEQEREARLQAEAALKEAAASADRIIKEQHDALEAEFAAERGRLEEQLVVLQQQCEQSRSDLAAAEDADVVAAEAAGDRIDQQEAESEVAQPLDEALASESKARARAANEESEAARLLEEVKRRQAELEALQGELSILRADAETRGAAIASLEDLLAKIERSTNGGTRRSSSQAGKGPSEDISVAALLRQLVHARLTEANAQKKLKLAAHAEAVLRQRIADRDGRIAALKAPVNDAQLEIANVPSGADDAAGDMDDQEMLKQQVADMGLELARREADVEHMTARAAAAEALSQEASSQQAERLRERKETAALRANLQDMQQDVQIAVASAVGALGMTSKPGQPSPTPDHKRLIQVVNLLATKIKDKDALIKRLRAAAKSAEDRLALLPQPSPGKEPGEASLRATVRSLSLKVSSLTRQASQLRAERDKAQAETGVSKEDGASCRSTPSTAECDKAQAEASVSKGDSASCRSTPSTAEPRVSGASATEGQCEERQVVEAAPRQTEQEPEASSSGRLADDDFGRRGVEEAAQQWKAKCLELQAQIADLTQQNAADKAKLQERLAEAQHAREAAVASQSAELQHGAQCADIRLAEAKARVATLERQAETIRAQADAAQEALRSEISAITIALEKEKAERARLLVSLKASLGGLRQAGEAQEMGTDVQALKDQLAAARSAQEAAEAKAAQRRKEAHSLRRKLEARDAQLKRLSADKELSHHSTTLHVSGELDDISRLEARLQAAEDKCAALEASACRRITKLSAQLDSVQPVPGTFEAALSAVQLLADELDMRFRNIQSQHTEGQHSEAASRQLQETVARLRDELSDLRLSEQAARQRMEDAKAEAAAQLHRLERMQQLAAEERERLAEKHAAALRGLDQRVEDERRALRREACAMASSASAAAAEKARAASQDLLREAEQRHQQQLAAADEQRQEAAAELQEMRTQFRVYQAAKALEITSLEARLRQAIQQTGAAAAGASAAMVRPVRKAAAGSLLRRPLRESDTNARRPETAERHRERKASIRGTAVSADGRRPFSSEIVQAGSSEALAAAMREADLERLQREAVEGQFAAAEDEVRALRERLKVAQREADAAGVAEKRLATEERRRLQEQLKTAQEAFKAAKAESARRLSSLQAVQAQLAAETASSEALRAERDGREAAESRLASAKAALAAKSSLVADLRTQLDEVMRRAHQEAQQREAAVSRASSLQAGLASKEKALRDARVRIDELAREAADSSTVAEAELRQLRAEVAKRESQVQAALAGADQARHEAGEALSAAEAASQREANALRNLAHCSASMRLAGTSFIRALTICSHNIHSSCATMQLAASAAQASALAAQDGKRARQGGQSGKGKEVGQWNSPLAIASLVDLRPDEIADLLGMQSSPGDSSRGEASRHLTQIESCFEAVIRAAGSPAAAKEGCANWTEEHIASLLEILEQELSRAQHTLVEASVQLPGVDSKIAHDLQQSIHEQ